MRRTRNISLALVSTFVMFSAVAPARAQETPLFDAFKRFCVDTRASPDAVQAAVEAAGGKFRVRNAQYGMPHMTVRILDYAEGGQKLVIAAGMSDTLVNAIANCTVSVDTKDDASVAAIRNWVRVRPYRTSPGSLATYSYSFQERGSERLALPVDRTAESQAEAQGRVWLITVGHSRDMASVQLSHVLAVSNNGKSN